MDPNILKKAMTGDRKRTPKLGDVVQIALPQREYAYARVYRDATIGVYKARSLEASQPPRGSREFAFFVGIYEDALRRCPVVGRDPFGEGESAWPPPRRVKDSITGDFRIYYQGAMRPATAEECAGLEPAAVWELDHVVDRLLGRFDWRSFK